MVSVSKTCLNFKVGFRNHRHHPCWENSKYESSQAIGRKRFARLPHKVQDLGNLNSGILVDQILAWVSYFL